jgi:hypothetical protein
MTTLSRSDRSSLPRDHGSLYPTRPPAFGVAGPGRFVNFCSNQTGTVLDPMQGRQGARHISQTRSTEDLHNHLDLKTGAKRNLRDTKGAARMRTALAKDFEKKF